jgi:GGDEF domain-containing protein
MKILEFKNRDSAKNHQLSVIYCDASSVKQIVQWYGGFHAGDDVDLTIDGVPQKLDLNLELVT